MATLSQKGGSPRGPLVPIIIAFLLQAGVAPQVSILGGRINFAVAAACALAPGMAPGSAALLGFGCGLVFDLTSSMPVGLMPLLLTIACFALAGASRGHALGLIAEGARLTGVAVTVVTLIYGLAVFLLGIETSFVAAVLSHGLITAVLTVIASLPFLAFSTGGERTGGFSAAGSRGTRFKTPR